MLPVLDVLPIIFCTLSEKSDDLERATLVCRVRV
jgi:hypothetical protein